MAAQIALAILLAILILIVEHYLPLCEMMGRELTYLERYVLGVLAMVLPISGLMAAWRRWYELAAIWAVVVVSGLAVMGVYALDNYLEAKKRMEAAENAEQILRDGTIEKE